MKLPQGEPAERGMTRWVTVMRLSPDDGREDHRSEAVDGVPLFGFETIRGFRRWQ
jgi:hypothetical protein